MPVLLVGDRDVASLLPMRECIESMTSVLLALDAATAEMPLRQVQRLPPDRTNMLACMPAAYRFDGGGGRASTKVITVFPGNDAIGLDSHQGAVLLFDLAGGQLLAVIDASSVTAIRTAAVSGVATRLLSRPDSARLAILGSGVQAATHLEAMCAVRPVAEVRVWSRHRDHAEAFATRMRGVHSIPIQVTGTAQDAVRQADIICTTTASKEPVLNGDWLPDGVHINAVGSSTKLSRELDSAAVAKSRVFVDRRESALNEAGDLLIPMGEQLIDANHIIGELGELLAGRVDGRRNGGEITLFKSLGLAVEDLAAAERIHRAALETKRGTWFELGGVRDASPPRP
jgi:ornithine cyclodeaminase